MVAFSNDALDASLCHGDLSLQICANTPDTNIHALRDVLKSLPDVLVLRWKQEGSVTDDDRNVLSAAVNTLAEDLSTLRGKLGLS